MPITASAKKQLRASERRSVVNIRRSRAMAAAVKEVKKAVLAKDAQGSRKALSSAYAAIDKAAKRGVIKKNNASRAKSRLSALAKSVK